MSTNKKTPSTLKNMIISLVLVGGFAAISLGLVYSITKAPIEQAKTKAEADAINQVIYSDFDNNPYEEQAILTGANGKDKLILFPARKDEKITSVAVKTFSDKAFGGKIEMIVGFFLDGTISGYKITDSKETPGLGSKISEAKFQAQFQGVNPQKHIFKVRQDGGEIDAVTAATISSRAVIDAIQKAFDAYSKFNTGN